MPVNPLELENIAKVVAEDAGALGREAAIVGKEGAAAAEKGIAGAEKAGINAEKAGSEVANAGKDVKEVPRFSPTKGILGGAVTAGAIAGIEKAIEGKNQSSDSDEGTEGDNASNTPTSAGTTSSAQSTGSGKSTGVGGAGTVEHDTPNGAQATAATQGGHLEGNDAVIALLRQILAVDTQSLSELHFGFRSLFEAYEQNTQSNQNEAAGDALQRNSSGGSRRARGSSVTPNDSLLGRAGRGIKGVGATLGIVALAGAVLPSLMHLLTGEDRTPSGAGSNTNDPTSSGAGSNTNDPKPVQAKGAPVPTKPDINSDAGVVNAAKEKFGENVYGTRLTGATLSDYFNSIKGSKMWVDFGKESPADKVREEYGLIRHLYEKMDGKGQDQAVSLLAKMNKMSPDAVRKIIVHENIPAVQLQRAAGAGIKRALKSTEATTVNLAEKAGGGVLLAASGIKEFFGYDGTSLANAGGELVDKGTKDAADINKEYVTGTSGRYLGETNTTAARVAYGAGIGASTLVGGAGGMLVKGLAIASGGAAAIGNTGYDPNAAVRKTLGLAPTKAKLGKADQGSAMEAMQFFMSHGWTQEQAAGIVANLDAESHFKTNVTGDGGQAYGIAQWHPDRQANFARLFHKDIRDSNFQEQLEFVQWELLNTDKGRATISKLQGVKDARQVAAIVDQNYEISANRLGSDAIIRGDLAESIDTAFQNFTPTQTTPNITPDKAMPPMPSSGGGGGSVMVADNSNGGVTVQNNAMVNTASAAAPPSVRRATTPMG